MAGLWKRTLAKSTAEIMHIFKGAAPKQTFGKIAANVRLLPENESAPWATDPRQAARFRAGSGQTLQVSPTAGYSRLHKQALRANRRSPIPPLFQHLIPVAGGRTFVGEAFGKFAGKATQNGPFKSNKFGKWRRRHSTHITHKRLSIIFKFSQLKIPTTYDTTQYFYILVFFTRRLLEWTFRTPIPHSHRLCSRTHSSPFFTKNAQPCPSPSLLRINTLSPKSTWFYSPDVRA